MIKKKKKVKRKRNPSPQFHDQLKDLLGIEVTVRFRNNTGFFSVTGELNEDGHNGYVVIGTDNTMMGVIRFNLRIIESVKVLSSGNFINLIPSTYHDYGTFYYLDDALRFINKNILIEVNTKMYKMQGLPASPYIRGKLKYNKKDQLFYIQSSNHNIQVSFVFEAIRWIDAEGNIDIEI
jgi:hypothetical protein